MHMAIITATVVSVMPPKYTRNSRHCLNFGTNKYLQHLKYKANDSIKGPFIPMILARQPTPDVTRFFVTGKYVARWSQCSLDRFKRKHLCVAAKTVAVPAIGIARSKARRRPLMYALFIPASWLGRESILDLGRTNPKNGGRLKHGVGVG